MNLRSRLRLVHGSLGLLALACGAPARPPPVPLPEGVTCTSVTTVGDSAALLEGLNSADAGSCVVASGGSYSGPFKVPAGVKLLAQQGETVEVSSQSLDKAAITVVGGVGSGLFQVQVVGSKAIGVRVQGGPAEVRGVTVSDAAQEGILVDCPAGADCAGATTISDAFLEKNGIGLWAAGAVVRVVGGSVRGSVDRSLTTGHGVVINSGAHFEASGLVIEDCDTAGLFIDGSGSRSTARLTGVTLRGNRGTGVIAQGLTGSLADPGLVIEGSSLLGNYARGRRILAASGVVVSDTVVRDTVQVSIPTGAGQLEDVGDGVVMGKASGDIRLERVTLGGNARAQVLIDDGRERISIVDSQVALESGRYLVVVQASLPVDVPASLVSDAGTLLSP